MLLLLCATADIAYALDLSHLMRNVRDYHAWKSVDFHKESTGQYRLSRAATEDKKNDVTLTVDAGISVTTKQCIESMEVVFKKKEVIYENLD